MWWDTDTFDNCICYLSMTIVSSKFQPMFRRYGECPEFHWALLRWSRCGHSQRSRSTCYLWWAGQEHGRRTDSHLGAPSRPLCPILLWYLDQVLQHNQSKSALMMTIYLLFHVELWMASISFVNVWSLKYNINKTMSDLAESNRGHWQGQSQRHWLWCNMFPGCFGPQLSASRC